MDRNGNFDYRNFFYPGPALPVQIYPVSGDPRFPFHFPPGTPNNVNMSDNITPAAREDITADETALNQHDTPDPPASVVAKRDAAAAQATAPVKLEHIVQGLSHQLEEAIKFCEECLATHKEVVSRASYAGHATRNGLWRELLESRFEASGVERDLLHALVPRVRRSTLQALQAARGDASGRSGEPDDDGDWHARLVLKAEKLSAEGGWVGQLNKRALGNTAACEDMVVGMKAMRVLCADISAGREGAAQDGQEGGGRQY